MLLAPLLALQAWPLRASPPAVMLHQLPRCCFPLLVLVLEAVAAAAVPPPAQVPALAGPLAAARLRLLVLRALAQALVGVQQLAAAEPSRRPPA